MPKGPVGSKSLAASQVRSQVGVLLETTGMARAVRRSGLPLTKFCGIMTKIVGHGRVAMRLGVEMLQKLFSSNVRVALLTHLFGHPGERFYARELARRLEEHYNAVWRELTNLESIGLLASEEAAGIKYYRLEPGFPIYEELKRIIFKTTGLGQALRKALVRLGNVDWAFIYGSLAAGDEDLLSDIDLMLIGSVDLMVLSEVVAGLEDELRRPINYLVLSRSELVQRSEAGEPLIENVLGGPKIMLVGEEDALRSVTAAGSD